MRIVRAFKLLLPVILSFSLAMALALPAMAAQPAISSLSPNSANAGGAAFTLTINGTNFTSTATAKWGTTALKPVYVNSTKLTAPIAAGLIATAGAIKVTVTTAGGTSTPATFTINPPKPAISSLSPDSAPPGGAAFTLTINGSNFTSTATAKWGATALKPVYVSPTKLTAPIAASLIASAGPVNVTVTTAGGTSTPATFNIIAPRPEITSLSPDSARAGSAGFTLTIYGSNFTPTAKVTWGTVVLVHTYVNATKLTAPISASLLATAGTLWVRVTTTGGASYPMIFTINPPKPVISSLSPNSATAGGAGFTLTINGANFTPTATANWGATALKPVYLSSTKLTAPIAASLIATAGTASVTVTAAGATSDPATFTISPQLQTKCTNNGSGNARLRGGYAFELSQIFLLHGNLQGFVAGVLTADGKGKITGGVYDLNGPAAPQLQGSGTLTGSYSVGPDNRGLLTLALSTGNTQSFCFALDSVTGGVAGSGRMVENDANGIVASGAFYAQGSSAFGLSSIKGSWAYGIQGGSPSNGKVARSALAGYLTADGAGKITVGESDVSQDKYDSGGGLTNNFFPQLAYTGTYKLASNGRGTMSLSFVQASTCQFAFYMAGPGRILVQSTDPAGTPGCGVGAGEAWLRTTSAFNKATLSGTYVFVSTALSDTNSTQYDQSKVKAGIVTSNGAGNLTITQDENDAGSVSLGQADSATYTVDASGRVTTGGGPVFYLVGAGQGFGVEGDAGVNFLTLEKQTVPKGGFTLASVAGAYSLGTLWYGSAKEDVWNGVLTSDGKGNITETLDVNSDGEIATDVTGTGSFTVSVAGRVEAGDAAIYLVSTGKGYSINLKSGKEYPPLLLYTKQ
jgi:hypothetical protein